jgi:phosphoserine phosphatase
MLGPAQLGAWVGRILGHLNSWQEISIRNKGYLHGMTVERLAREAEACLAPDPQGLILPDLHRRIEEHRARGDCLVLISGTLEPLLAVFSRVLRFDISLGTSLEAHDGVLSGEIAGEHPYGRAKRGLWEAIAAEHGLDARRSCAYANHASDLPLLEAVGSPIAVNPDRILRRTARRRGWTVLTL